MRESVSHRRSTFPGSVLGLLLVTLVTVGCGRGGSEPVAVQSEELPWPERPNSDYVGSAACVGCHEDAAHEFHSHPMSRSAAEVLRATPSESFEKTEFQTVRGLEYYVEKTETGVIHHERRLDPQGVPIYDQGLPVAYTVGSGTRGRSYLLNFDGRMYASPISWYADPLGWDLSPGYVPENHARFERRVSHGCVVCHVGRAQPHPEDLDRFTSEPIVEAAIGCENCHGPGKAHIAFHESSTGPRQGDDPIVNPEKLTGARKDAVCNQCHLQGHRRVVRYGRTEFDFRPGMLLSDNWVVFLKTLKLDGHEAAAVSQVEQMYSSKCFTETAGALSCLSCHDGHQVLDGDEAARGYRSRCLECHGAGKTECSESPAARQIPAPADSCVACHMPKFPASDVHASQTDHRVLKRPVVPQANDPPPAPRPGPKRANLFIEPGATIPQVEIDRARAIFLAEQADGFLLKDQAKEAINVMLPLLKRVPKDVEGRYALGRAFEAFGDSKLAIEAWKQVLELQPNHESAWENLALAYLSSNRNHEAQQALERLTSINPERSFYFGRLAFVLGLNGDLRNGVAAAERALELNPSLVQTHIWLSEAYRRLGNEERAQHHAETAARFGRPEPTDDSSEK